MSSHSERDRTTDALLRASLSRLPGGDAPAGCVDAETLAAWSERALPAPDAARIDAHLADCSRCQALLAAFVRTEPEAAAAATAPIWARWPTFKWLVPAATLAATVVIVAVLTRETRDAALAPVQMARQEVSNAAPAPAQERPAEATADQAASLSDRADAEARSNEIRQSAAGAPAPPITAPAAPAAPPPQSRPTLTDGAPNVSLGAAGQAAAAQTRPAPTADAEKSSAKLDSVQVTNIPLDRNRSYQALVVLTPGAQQEPGPGARSEAGAPAQRTVSFSNVVAEIVSAPRAAFAAAGSGGRAGRGRAGAARAAEAAAEAAALPNTIPARWRILATGVVERSTNGGATWHAVTVDTRVLVSGGVSPSDLVCWLIGPGGTVVLSTDGLTLRRVPFPETTDLVSVAAENDRQATVTTADGRTFVTFDGGATWTRRQP